jgi:trehalose synthase
MQTVEVGSRPLAAYRGLASDGMLAALARAAERLRGARVLHLNATPYGGGAAELLQSMVPLLRGLGIAADWKVLSAEEAFFTVTKAIHNGLQGAELALSSEEQAVYRETSERNAALFDDEYDFVLVHDPQPAAVLPLHGRGRACWVWRCHIDTSAPHPDAWAFIRPFLTDYDAAVFTLGEFSQPDLPIGTVDVIPPAIDPLTPKNAQLADGEARAALRSLGLDLGRPLVTQISRFDPWKDPGGVIAAYRLARRAVPDLQLALAGSMAHDDPEGSVVHEEIADASDADPAVHVYTNLDDREVNALQRLSDVCIQKSVREGFGLVVSEAMWKGTPVVAGRTGGIPLQMADGVGGVLVDGVPECAEAIVQLLGDRARSRELARSGQERVREHFLLPRLLLNEVSLLTAIAEAHTAAEWRDPVCGIAMCPHDGNPAATNGASTFRFCSAECHDRFRRSPERYTPRAAAEDGDARRG